MSNLWVNIRIGLYHFQFGPDDWFSIDRNDFHRGYREGYFKVYKFFNLI